MLHRALNKIEAVSAGMITNTVIAKEEVDVARSGYEVKAGIIHPLSISEG